MVLEGATTADSSFSDDIPSSDADPYSSQSKTTDRSLLAVTGPPNPIYVNLDSLPKRWSLIGSKAHPPSFGEGIVEQCNFASQLLQRPVTQDEANALAFHFAKSMRIGSYGSPIGAVLGTAFAMRGQANYRFPFWTPMKEGSRFSPDVFGPLKGQAARSAWNMARLSAYWIVGSAACQIFFGSYALTVAMTGRTLDPRLKEFTETVKEKVRQRGNGRPLDETPARRGPETFDMARQRRSAQEMRRTGGQEPQSRDDDASPTGGMFASDYQTTSNEPVMQTDEQVRQEETTRERSAEQQFVKAQAAPANAGNTTPTNSRQSSWDRLRQGAISGQSSRPSKPAPSGQTPSEADPFALSTSDREVADARFEAQRQFDQSIERERTGKDFEDTKSGGWRR